MMAFEFVVLLISVPIIAYCDYLILKSAFEAEYGVKVKWTYWIVPTFMEIIMFLVGIGLAISLKL